MADVNPVLESGDESAIAHGNDEHILLVDDEKDLLDATQKLLSSIGYEASVFSDPVEALHAFEPAPAEFDLLVSDQSMLNITGFSY